MINLKEKVIENTRWVANYLPEYREELERQNRKFEAYLLEETEQELAGFYFTQMIRLGNSFLGPVNVFIYAALAVEVISPELAREFYQEAEIQNYERLMEVIKLLLDSDKELKHICESLPHEREKGIEEHVKEEIERYKRQSRALWKVEESLSDRKIKNMSYKPLYT